MSDPLIVYMVNKMIDAGILVVIDGKVVPCERVPSNDPDKNKKFTPLSMKMDLSKTNIDKEMELLRNHEAKQMRESIEWAQGVLTEFFNDQEDSDDW